MGLIAWPVRHPRHWRPVHLLGSQLFPHGTLASSAGANALRILDLPVSVDRALQMMPHRRRRSAGSAGSAATR